MTALAAAEELGVQAELLTVGRRARLTTPAK
jgi:hypothetical protein